MKRVSNEARQLRNLLPEAAMGAERLETATVEEMVNAERDFERAEVEAARSGVVPTMSAEDAEEIDWDLHIEFDDAPDVEEPPPQDENVFQLELFLARVHHHKPMPPPVPVKSSPPPLPPTMPPPLPTRATKDHDDRRTTPPPPDWDPVRMSRKRA
jgi:hypothetical protein